MCVVGACLCVCDRESGLCARVCVRACGCVPLREWVRVSECACVDVCERVRESNV